MTGPELIRPGGTRKKRGAGVNPAPLVTRTEQRIGQSTSDAWKERLGHSAGA
jgi:hypothetical protein